MLGCAQKDLHKTSSEPSLPTIDTRGNRNKRPICSTPDGFCGKPSDSGKRGCKRERSRSLSACRTQVPQDNVLTENLSIYYLEETTRFDRPSLVACSSDRDLSAPSPCRSSREYSSKKPTHCSANSSEGDQKHQNVESCDRPKLKCERNPHNDERDLGAPSPCRSSREYSSKKPTQCSTYFSERDNKVCSGAQDLHQTRSSSHHSIYSNENDSCGTYRTRDLCGSILGKYSHPSDQSSRGDHCETFSTREHHKPPIRMPSSRPGHSNEEDCREPCPTRVEHRPSRNRCETQDEHRPSLIRRETVLTRYEQRPSLNRCETSPSRVEHRTPLIRRETSPTRCEQRPSQIRRETSPTRCEQRPSQIRRETSRTRCEQRTSLVRRETSQTRCEQRTSLVRRETSPTRCEQRPSQTRRETSPTRCEQRPSLTRRETSPTRCEQRPSLNCRETSPTRVDHRPSIIRRETSCTRYELRTSLNRCETSPSRVEHNDRRGASPIQDEHRPSLNCLETSTTRDKRRPSLNRCEASPSRGERRPCSNRRETSPTPDEHRPSLNRCETFPTQDERKLSLNRCETSIPVEHHRYLFRMTSYHSVQSNEDDLCETSSTRDQQIPFSDCHETLLTREEHKYALNRCDTSLARDRPRPSLNRCETFYLRDYRKPVTDSCHRSSQTPENDPCKTISTQRRHRTSTNRYETSPCDRQKSLRTSSQQLNQSHKDDFCKIPLAREQQEPSPPNCYESCLPPDHHKSRKKSYRPKHTLEDDRYETSPPRDHPKKHKKSSHHLNQSNEDGRYETSPPRDHHKKHKTSSHHSNQPDDVGRFETSPPRDHLHKKHKKSFHHSNKSHEDKRSAPSPCGDRCRSESPKSPDRLLYSNENERTAPTPCGDRRRSASPKSPDDSMYSNQNERTAPTPCGDRRRSSSPKSPDDLMYSNQNERYFHSEASPSRPSPHRSHHPCRDARRSTSLKPNEEGSPARIGSITDERQTGCKHARISPIREYESECKTMHIATSTTTPWHSPPEISPEVEDRCPIKSRRRKHKTRLHRSRSPETDRCKSPDSSGASSQMKSLVALPLYTPNASVPSSQMSSSVSTTYSRPRKRSDINDNEYCRLNSRRQRSGRGYSPSRMEAKKYKSGSNKVLSTEECLEAIPSISNVFPCEKCPRVNCNCEARRVQKESMIKRCRIAGSERVMPRGFVPTVPSTTRTKEENDFEECEARTTAEPKERKMFEEYRKLEKTGTKEDRFFEEYEEHKKAGTKEEIVCKEYKEQKKAEPEEEEMFKELKDSETKKEKMFEEDKEFKKAETKEEKIAEEGKVPSDHTETKEEKIAEEGKVPSDHTGEITVEPGVFSEAERRIRSESVRELQLKQHVPSSHQRRESKGPTGPILRDPNTPRTDRRVSSVDFKPMTEMINPPESAGTIKTDVRPCEKCQGYDCNCESNQARKEFIIKEIRQMMSNLRCDCIDDSTCTSDDCVSKILKELASKTTSKPDLDPNDISETASTVGRSKKQEESAATAITTDEDQKPTSGSTADSATLSESESKAIRKRDEKPLLTDTTTEEEGVKVEGEKSITSKSKSEIREKSITSKSKSEILKSGDSKSKSSRSIGKSDDSKMSKVSSAIDESKSEATKSIESKGESSEKTLQAGREKSLSVSKKQVSSLSTKTDTSVASQSEKQSLPTEITSEEEKSEATSHEVDSGLTPVPSSSKKLAFHDLGVGSDDVTTENVQVQTQGLSTPCTTTDSAGNLIDIYPPDKITGDSIAAESDVETSKTDLQSQSHKDSKSREKSDSTSSEAEREKDVFPKSRSGVLPLQTTTSKVTSSEAERAKDVSSKSRSGVLPLQTSPSKATSSEAERAKDLSSKSRSGVLPLQTSPSKATRSEAGRSLGVSSKSRSGVLPPQTMTSKVSDEVAGSVPSKEISVTTPSKSKISSNIAISDEVTETVPSREPAFMSPSKIKSSSKTQISEEDAVLVPSTERSIMSLTKSKVLSKIPDEEAVPAPSKESSIISLSKNTEEDAEIVPSKDRSPSIVSSMIPLPEEVAETVPSKAVSAASNKQEKGTGHPRFTERSEVPPKESKPSKVPKHLISSELSSASCISPPCAEGRESRSRSACRTRPSSPSDRKYRTSPQRSQPPPEPGVDDIAPGTHSTKRSSKKSPSPVKKSESHKIEDKISSQPSKASRASGVSRPSHLSAKSSQPSTPRSAGSRVSTDKHSVGSRKQQADQKTTAKITGSKERPSSQPTVSSADLKKTDKSAVSMPRTTSQPTMSSADLKKTEKSTASIPRLTSQPKMSSADLKKTEKSSASIPRLTSQPRMSSADLKKTEKSAMSIPRLTSQPAVSSADFKKSNKSAMSISRPTSQPTESSADLRSTDKSTGSIPRPKSQPTESSGEYEPVESTQSQPQLTDSDSQSNIKSSDAEREEPSIPQLPIEESLPTTDAEREEPSIPNLPIEETLPTTEKIPESDQSTSSRDKIESIPVTEPSTPSTHGSHGKVESLPGSESSTQSTRSHGKVESMPDSGQSTRSQTDSLNKVDKQMDQEQQSHSVPSVPTIAQGLEHSRSRVLPPKSESTCRVPLPRVPKQEDAQPPYLESSESESLSKPQVSPSTIRKMKSESSPDRASHDVDCTCKKCIGTTTCHCCASCPCSNKRKPEDIPSWIVCDSYNTPIIPKGESERVQRSSMTAYSPRYQPLPKVEDTTLPEKQSLLRFHSPIESPRSSQENKSGRKNKTRISLSPIPSCSIPSIEKSTPNLDDSADVKCEVRLIRLPSRQSENFQEISVQNTSQNQRNSLSDRPFHHAQDQRRSPERIAQHVSEDEAITRNYGSHRRSASRSRQFSSALGQEGNEIGEGERSYRSDHRERVSRRHRNEDGQRRTSRTQSHQAHGLIQEQNGSNRKTTPRQDKDSFSNVSPHQPQSHKRKSSQRTLLQNQTHGLDKRTNVDRGELLNQDEAIIRSNRRSLRSASKGRHPSSTGQKENEIKNEDIIRGSRKNLRQVASRGKQPNSVLGQENNRHRESDTSDQDDRRERMRRRLRKEEEQQSSKAGTPSRQGHGRTRERNGSSGNSSPRRNKGSVLNVSPSQPPAHRTLQPKVGRSSLMTLLQHSPTHSLDRTQSVNRLSGEIDGPESSRPVQRRSTMESPSRLTESPDNARSPIQEGSFNRRSSSSSPSPTQRRSSSPNFDREGSVGNLKNVSEKESVRERLQKTQDTKQPPDPTDLQTHEPQPPDSSEQKYWVLDNREITKPEYGVYALPPTHGYSPESYSEFPERPLTRRKDYGSVLECRSISPSEIRETLVEYPPHYNRYSSYLSSGESYDRRDSYIDPYARPELGRRESSCSSILSDDADWNMVAVRPAVYKVRGGGRYFQTAPVKRTRTRYKYPRREEERHQRSEVSSTTTNTLRTHSGAKRMRKSVRKLKERTSSSARFSSIISPSSVSGRSDVFSSISALNSTTRVLSDNTSLVTMPPLDNDDDYYETISMESLPRTPMDVMSSITSLPRVPLDVATSTSKTVQDINYCDERKRDSRIVKEQSEQIHRIRSELKPMFQDEDDDWETKELQKTELELVKSVPESPSVTNEWAVKEEQRLEQAASESVPVSPSETRASPSGASHQSHNARAKNQPSNMSNFGGNTVTNIHTKKYECGCQEIVREYTTTIDGGCGKEACPCGCAGSQVIQSMTSAHGAQSTSRTQQQITTMKSKSGSMCYCDNQAPILHCPDEKSCECNFNCDCPQQWQAILDPEFTKSKSRSQPKVYGSKMFCPDEKPCDCNFPCDCPDVYRKTTASREPVMETSSPRVVESRTVVRKTYSNMHCPDEKACDCPFKCDCPEKWPEVKCSVCPVDKECDCSPCAPETCLGTRSCECMAWDEEPVHKDTQTSNVRVTKVRSEVSGHHYTSEHSSYAEVKPILERTPEGSNCQLYPSGEASTTCRLYPHGPRGYGSSTSRSMTSDDSECEPGCCKKFWCCMWGSGSKKKKKKKSSTSSRTSKSSKSSKTKSSKKSKSSKKTSPCKDKKPKKEKKKKEKKPKKEKKKKEKKPKCEKKKKEKKKKEKKPKCEKKKKEKKKKEKKKKRKVKKCAKDCPAECTP